MSSEPTTITAVVEEIRTGIGVGGAMFNVDTETGKMFKFLQAPKLQRRRSRLTIQIESARATGSFSTRQTNVAHCDEQRQQVMLRQEQQRRLLDSEKRNGADVVVLSPAGGAVDERALGQVAVSKSHQVLDAHSAGVAFSGAGTSKEARKRAKMRKRKIAFAEGEAALRDDLRMFPSVHKLLPLPLLRKFDSEQPDLAQRRRARPKALIVDGNLWHLAACKIVFEKYFEVVQCVRTADQAIDLLDHVVFDIALIAPDLPGDLSGLDLVDAIRLVEQRSRHSFRTLVICALTSEQVKDATLLDTCFCSGMDRFLLKPAVLYVQLLCDLIMSGSSHDAFRRLALETQWVSRHEDIQRVFGDDATARENILAILNASGTEEIGQKEVAALIVSDSDRTLVNGLHERQRHEELNRIINATAQMKRRIADLEYEIELLEEEKSRKTYSETRNLSTLLALETRLKEAEHDLHEKAREAQQSRFKAEEYRADLKNLLDNGSVNAAKVAKANAKVAQYKRCMEANERQTMERLDIMLQSSWNNYYGEATHRSHFEIDQYVPRYATDASASWYRNEIAALVSRSDKSVETFQKSVEELRNKVYRFIDADQPDVGAIINVVRDQVSTLSRKLQSESSSLRFAVNESAANILTREIQFWKLMEDDEPRFRSQMDCIKEHLVTIKTRFYDQTKETQTETFLWDHQTSRDLNKIIVDMMSVSCGDADVAVLMERSAPYLPDGSYSPKMHAAYEIFHLPIEIQQALAESPVLQALVPLIPFIKSDIVMQERTRRVVFGAVCERLQLLHNEAKASVAQTKRLVDAVLAIPGPSHVAMTSEIEEAFEIVKQSRDALMEAAKRQVDTKDSCNSPVRELLETAPLATPRAVAQTASGAAPSMRSLVQRAALPSPLQTRKSPGATKSQPPKLLQVLSTPQKSTASARSAPLGTNESSSTRASVTAQTPTKTPNAKIASRRPSANSSVVELAASTPDSERLRPNLSDVLVHDGEGETSSKSEETTNSAAKSRLRDDSVDDVTGDAVLFATHLDRRESGENTLRTDTAPSPVIMVPDPGTCEISEQDFELMDVGIEKMNDLRAAAHNAELSLVQNGMVLEGSVELLCAHRSVVALCSVVETLAVRELDLQEKLSQQDADLVRVSNSLQQCAAESFARLEAAKRCELMCIEARLRALCFQRALFDARMLCAGRELACQISPASPLESSSSGPKIAETHNHAPPSSVTVSEVSDSSRLAVAGLVLEQSKDESVSAVHEETKTRNNIAAVSEDSDVVPTEVGDARPSRNSSAAVVRELDARVTPPQAASGSKKHLVEMGVSQPSREKRKPSLAEALTVSTKREKVQARASGLQGQSPIESDGPTAATIIHTSHANSDKQRLLKTNNARFSETCDTTASHRDEEQHFLPVLPSKPSTKDTSRAPRIFQQPVSSTTQSTIMLTSAVLSHRPGTLAQRRPTEVIREAFSRYNNPVTPTDPLTFRLTGEDANKEIHVVSMPSKEEPSGHKKVTSGVVHDFRGPTTATPQIDLLVKPVKSKSHVEKDKCLIEPPKEAPLTASPPPLLPDPPTIHPERLAHSTEAKKHGGRRHELLAQMMS